MAVSTRSRRLTGPLSEKVRERIFGFGSPMSSASSTSGSEHDAELNDDVSSSSPSSESPCLSYLVRNFLETSGGVDPSAVGDSVESEDETAAFDPTALIRDVITPLVWSNADRFRADLLAHVTSAVEMFSLLSGSPAVLNRSVMSYLREIGYNAGVCKTNWEAIPSRGVMTGCYEFIDVVQSSPSSDSISSEPDSRYVIDLNFACQFEIAGETDGYKRVLRALPRVFVGVPEDLKRIVRIMADEATRSMKINGMSLPPWRKNRYMQAKWFGPYRRTVNQLAVSAAVASTSAVKCRSVGFFASAADGGGGGLLVAPPTTRTR